MTASSLKIQDKIYKSTIVKFENKWYFTEINEDLIDVIVSGFISAGEQISEEILSQ